MTDRERVPGQAAGLVAAILMMMSLMAASVGAAGPHRAGLVIAHGNGQITTRCVEFAEDTISGLELIRRAGVDLNVDDSNSIGVAVCKLDNEGCSFPGQSCFCQCEGSICTYWSYWQQAADGGWASSNLGAAVREVHDGDVDGWVWGAGTTTSANPPPPAAFGDICLPPTPTITLEPTATQTRRVTSTPEPPTDTPQPLSALAGPSTATAAFTSTTLPPTSPPAPATADAAPVAPGPSPSAGTPVITTPTAPASAPERLSDATSPAQPTAAVGLTPAVPTQAIATTAVASPALVARIAQSPTPRHTRTLATPTRQLAAIQDRAPVPPSSPAPASRPPAALLVLGLVLTGAGVCGAVLLTVSLVGPWSDRPRSG